MEKKLDCQVQVGSSHKITALYVTQYRTGEMAVLADRFFPNDDPITDDPMERELDGTKEQNAISINLVEHSGILRPGEFFLKNYSEGEETADALLSAGILVATGVKVRSGFVEVPIVRFAD